MMVAMIMGTMVSDVRIDVRTDMRTNVRTAMRSAMRTAVRTAVRTTATAMGTTAAAMSTATTAALTAVGGKLIESLAELLLRFRQRRHGGLAFLQQLFQVLPLLCGNVGVVGQIVPDLVEHRHVSRETGVLDLVPVIPNLGVDLRRHLGNRDLKRRVGCPDFAGQFIGTGQFALQLAVAGGCGDLAEALQGRRVLRLGRDPHGLFEQLLRGEALMRT